MGQFHIIKTQIIQNKMKVLDKQMFLVNMPLSKQVHNKHTAILIGGLVQVTSDKSDNCITHMDYARTIN